MPSITAEQRHIVSEVYEYPGTEPLTPMELRVLELIADGHTDPAIAALTISSPNTIRTHVQNLRYKLRARSKAEAVSKGFRLGYLT